MSAGRVPLEEHMAHFYKNIKTEQYRTQLKAFWIEHYGQAMTDKAIQLAQPRKK